MDSNIGKKRKIKRDPAADVKESVEIPRKKKNWNEEDTIGNTVIETAVVEAKRDGSEDKLSKKKKKAIMEKDSGEKIETTLVAPSMDDSQMEIPKKKKKHKKKKHVENYGESVLVDEIDSAEKIERSSVTPNIDDSQTEFPKKKKKHKKKKHTEDYEDAVLAQETEEIDSTERIEAASVTPNIDDTQTEFPKKKKKHKKKKHSEDSREALHVEGMDSTEKIETAVVSPNIDESQRGTQNKKQKDKKKEHVEDSEEVVAESTADVQAPYTGQWGNASLGSGERNEKFLRLMGGFKSANESKGVKKRFASSAFSANKQEKLYKGLESQYEQAFETTRIKKGLGLGFVAEAEVEPSFSFQK